MSAIESGAALFDIPHNRERQEAATITQVITTTCTPAGGLVFIKKSIVRHVNNGRVRENVEQR